MSVLNLTLYSLTTIYVKPHQCPLHQFILLTQEPIPKFSWEILRIGVFEKLSFFESAILMFFATSLWKSVTNFVVEWMGLNLIMMVYSQKWSTSNINTASVYLDYLLIARLFLKIKTITKSSGKIFIGKMLLFDKYKGQRG